MFAAAVKLSDFVLHGLEGILHVILRSEICVPTFKARRNSRCRAEMRVGPALAEIGLDFGNVENQIPFGLELCLRRFVCPFFRFLERCAELFGILESGRIVADGTDAGPEILRRVQTRLSAGGETWITETELPGLAPDDGNAGAAQGVGEGHPISPAALKGRYDSQRVQAGVAGECWTDG